MSFIRFVNELDRRSRVSESAQAYDAKKLRATARKAGESLFKSHKSGLLLGDQITVIPFTNFISEDDTYDTWMYVFDPTTGIGRDLADQPIKEAHAVHGVIHIGWPDGILLVTLPGIKASVSGDAGKTIFVPEIEAKTKEALDPEIAKMSARVQALGFKREGRGDHPQIWKKMYPENVKVEVHIEEGRSCVDSINVKTWHSRKREDFDSVKEMETLIVKHSEPIAQVPWSSTSQPLFS